MSTPIGRFIRERRQALGLKQEETASRLGISRVALTRYEAGDRSVPVALLAGFAEVLGVEADMLASLRDGARRAGVEAVRERAPLTPLSCSVEQMLVKLPGARGLHDHVRLSIGEGPYDDLRSSFLRQTAAELALPFVALADNTELLWTSPLEAGSGLLCVDEDRRSFNGHLLRLALEWRHERERITLFPQVSLLVPKVDKRYRVDYLAVHAVPGRRTSNVVVEFDGQIHPLQQERDAARAEDLRLPLVRFDNTAVLSPNFFVWLIRGIRSKSEAALINDTEFQRFVHRRRRAYDAAG